MSINSKNPLIDSLFNPVRMPSNTNWGAVDRETKDKWDAARAIVSSDDRGSWGSNFHAHSHEVKEIFPEIKTAEELYEGKFQNLMRLVKWADKKVRGSGLEKNVKILAFGHENYLVVALDRYFHEHNINNCETIRLKVEDRIVKGEFHDKEAEIG
ncbi:MAG: hypothetical protein A2W80_10420 [Candidatus Riflebacteria bacterium GWC2_50_8]|nr:MAG: hypothetical protein A2W80_10420 [Candidatus Riflebacteria bacterium GWC2_50_8]